MGMIVIACVDQNNGMLFHRRRQSKDRAVRGDILRMLNGKTLWMNAYSYGQFGEDDGNFCVEEEFLSKAGAGEYCFVEDQMADEKMIEKLILYRWDKVYPADRRLEFDLGEWKPEEFMQMQGYSHAVITREVYLR